MSESAAIHSTGERRVSKYQLTARRVILLGTPLLAAVVLSFHSFGVGDGGYYEQVAAAGDQWLAAHFLFLPILGLLAASLHLLLAGYRGVISTIARIGIATFGIFYVALEVVAGITAGIIVRNTQSLPAEQQEGVKAVVDTLFTHPIIGGASLSVFVVLAILGYFLAVVATSIVLYRSGAPLVPLILLVCSVIGIASHGVPTGPVGMLLLFVAVAWLELRWNPSAAADDGTNESGVHG